MAADAVKLTTDANGKHPGDAGFDPNNIAVYGMAFKGSKTLASTWEWYNYLYAFGGDVFDGKFNITVNTINPGVVETAMTAQWPDEVKRRMAGVTPLGRIAVPDDIGAVSEFLISDLSGWVTGETIEVNGGAYFG